MTNRAKAVLTVVVIAVVAAATVFLLIRTFQSQQNISEKHVTQTDDSAAASLPVELHVHEHDREEATVHPDVTLPAANGTPAYFSGTYTPDIRAEDIVTEHVVHLRELFGSGYADATITFQEDGTFTDTLPATGVRKGIYYVENGALVAAYQPGEVMDISVTEWSAGGTKPAAFCVIYKTVGEKGYRVFYSEK